MRSPGESLSCLLNLLLYKIIVNPGFLVTTMFLIYLAIATNRYTIQRLLLCKIVQNSVEAFEGWFLFSCSLFYSLWIHNLTMTINNMTFSNECTWPKQYQRCVTYVYISHLCLRQLKSEMKRQWHIFTYLWSENYNTMNDIDLCSGCVKPEPVSFYFFYNRDLYINNCTINE